MMNTAQLSTLFAILTLAITPLLHAGEYNQVLSVGDAAPPWVELPGVDGKKHSLTDMKQHDVVVVAFICNSCGYVADAEDRLLALVKDYGENSVGFVAINVNKIQEDRLPAMKEHAKSSGFNFPYVFDETQQIAKKFGAIYTPEFYVLNKDRKVVYMGSLDDSPDGKKITKRYLRTAIEAALVGEKPEMQETVPIGCRVRYENERRGRRKKAE